MPAFAKQANASDSFVPPRTLKLTNPSFPEMNWRRGKEGWVSVSFMVDPQGATYDAGQRYNIKPDLGGCTLIVLGDPGTTFSLVEYH